MLKWLLLLELVKLVQLHLKACSFWPAAVQ